jgi:flavin reductase (DIM6/NTAB) family NADH-FMN oxidoreductase RutF
MTRDSGSPAAKIDVQAEHWDRVFSPTSLLALITSVDRQGRVNAAPFGSCIRVCHDPVDIAFTVNSGSLCGSSRRAGESWSHDTCDNVLATGEFVVNVVPFERAVIERLFVCGLAFKSGVNELERAGLSAIASQTVKPPRIAECHAHFECKVLWTREWGHRTMILGRVSAVSADEGCLDATGWPLLDRIKPVHFCHGKVVPAFQVTSVPWEYTGSRAWLVEGFNEGLSGPAAGPPDSMDPGRPGL